jgi:hypothetical protein
MKWFKKLGGIGLFLAALTAVAVGANLQYRTGPVDVSDFRAVVNQLVQDINSGTAGLLYVNGTSTANAGTIEATIYSYTLPAGYLAANGQSIRARCYVATAATADDKTVLLYFGSQSVTTGLAANNAGGGFIDMVVTRTGAATQTIEGYGQFGAAGVTPVIVQHVAGTQDLATALDIRCRATDEVTAGTIGKMLMVETIR